ncbi:phage baseplate assembly protein V [Azorhizobium caulinodans]|nr:phage baseplate assembly protein V [Azorhizobium caulinodans]
MALVEQEIRRLHRKVNQTERRLASSKLKGVVAEVDAAKRRCRVQIGATADGKPVLSPWIPWREPANGLLSTHTPILKGDLVTVESPSGTLGTASIAVRDAYSGARAAPSTAEDAVVEKLGGLVVTRRDGALEIQAGGVTVRIDGAGLTVTGGDVSHNGKSIGAEHKHGKVMGGDSTSGPPV